MNERVKTPDPKDVAPVEVPLAAAEPAKPAKKRSGLRILLMVLVPAVLIGGGAYFYLTGGRYIDTDNAYVQQPKVSISSDVAGRIISVAVVENQQVRAGDVLFAIDPEPYRIALSQADAALASARVNVEQLHVGLAIAKAKLESAKITLDIRQKDWDRKTALQSQGVTAVASLDDARLALQTALSTVALEEQDVANATAALGGDPAIKTEDHPAVRAAQAARDNSARNLEKTTILAPDDGIVSQVASLNVGQFIAIGSTIATLVETQETWIEANFKETQLTALTVGMPAEVSIDAFPSLKLECSVDSIGAATGAEFALIPAQNATGNWVKVVQRIPVNFKCGSEGTDALRAGMSAAVSVDTQPTTTAAVK